MKPEDEMVLKVTKEIIVKFIEIGRLSLGGFDEAFKQIHSTVYGSLKTHSTKEKSKSK